MHCLMARVVESSAGGGVGTAAAAGCASGGATGSASVASVAGSSLATGPARSSTRVSRSFLETPITSSLASSLTTLSNRSCLLRTRANTCSS